MARDLVARELAHDPPFRHDQHAVAQIGQLIGFRGYDQHRHATLGQRADEAVDFGACADVDAARRLIENEHLGPRLQPTPDHDFLLIAATELSDRNIDARGLDREVADGALGQRLCDGAR